MVVDLSEEAAKPVTTVQDCVSTFVSVTQLDILKEAAVNFQLHSWKPCDIQPAQSAGHQDTSRHTCHRLQTILSYHFRTAAIQSSLYTIF